MSANNVRLDDGFSTLVTIQNLPTVKLYEKEVTPPGVTGGGAIDTTTMRNTAWRTMAPKALKSLSAVSMVVALATDAIPLVQAQVGVNQLITVTFPDASSFEFFGWIDEFTPGKFAEGEQPTATVTIQPSLIHSLTNDETAPVYNEPGSSA